MEIEQDRKLLQSDIASAAYSIGFGAKAHFATMEIATKAPGWISFLSLAIGVFALIIPALTAPALAATLIVVGVIPLYLTYYQDRLSDYDARAKDLLKKFYDLQDLCARAEIADGAELSSIRAQMVGVRREAKEVASYRQIFLSGWLAHLKFWGQAESAWVERYRDPKITFLKDKVPRSLLVLLITLVIVTAVMFAWRGACPASWVFP
jgi:hypothetical protein